MNAQGPEMEEEDDEMVPHDPNVVVIDIGKSCSVSIPKKYAEDHLPRLAPGKSKILEFQDFPRKNNFRMEFVHSNFGDYYLRTGWERYRDEHKLEYGDFISFYKKKENQNGNDDTGSEDTYVMTAWKLPKLEPDTTEPADIVQVLVKNLCYNDLYKNPIGLRLLKKEVEENLFDLPLPKVGEEIIVPLFDSIGRKWFTVQLVHGEQEGYYLGGKGWEEYVTKHKLLIFDTIFVNKIIWDPSEEVPLVNISFHYEITYQLRNAKSQKKQKKIGKMTENSSAPASSSTTTAAAAENNSSAPASTATTTGDNCSAPASTATTTSDNRSKGNGLQRNIELNCDEPEYDNDDAYWL